MLNKGTMQSRRSLLFTWLGASLTLAIGLIQPDRVQAQSLSIGGVLTSAAKAIGSRSRTIQTGASNNKRTSRQEHFIPAATGTGTQGKIAKWTDSLGTLGDSVIVESSGNISIGNTANLNLLDVGSGVLPTLVGKAIALSNTSGNSTFGFGQSSTARARLAWLYNATEANAYILLGDAFGTHHLVLQDAGGNVGIGTASPVTRLDVAPGQIHVAGICSSSVPNLQGTYLSWNQLSCSTGETDFINHQGLGPGGFAFMNTPNGTSLSTLMLITGAGNLGIGTTAPGAKLHISGPTAGFGAGIKLTNTDPGGKTFSLYAFPTSFIIGDETAGLVRMAIDTNGNVGVGTSTPSTKLHVVGDVTVTGNIAAKYQDVAELVPARRQMPAGTVVVLDAERSNQVIASSRSYDTRVAGVISSSPGLLLGERGEDKVMVATTGRVRVKVDATGAPIRVGDLLVTSDKEGMAMRSQPIDLGGTPIHRPGTMIGKALEPLDKGVGEILVLLSLQ